MNELRYCHYEKGQSDNDMESSHPSVYSYAIMSHIFLFRLPTVRGLIRVTQSTCVMSTIHIQFTDSPTIYISIIDYSE